MKVRHLALIAFRVIASIVGGGLAYWVFMMLLTAVRDVSFLGGVLVLLSPLTIFGWLTALGFMVAAYFLLRRSCF
jgi:hypothetical protein